MFANTCRHRGHELLPDGDVVDRARRSSARTTPGPTTSTATLKAAPGYRDGRGFDTAEYALVELPVRGLARLGVRPRAAPARRPDVAPFADHLGELDRIVAPYDSATLVLADRHTYEVAANWKVIAENYHECYHCPLIHPELCAGDARRTPATTTTCPAPGSAARWYLRDGDATRCR